jgi:large subunit ribosomal protein L10
MPNQKNLSEVKELEAKLAESSAVFLADYAGLTVKAQGELRNAVRAAGGDLRVSKNRLLKIALKNSGYDTDALQAELTGPNLTLFAANDAVSPLKALVEFAKANELEKPSIKTGVLGKEILSITKIKQLASLPGKNELIAKLMYTIKGPLSGMVNVLAAPARDLVYALNAIKEKKAAN